MELRPPVGADGCQIGWFDVMMMFATNIRLCLCFRVSYIAIAWISEPQKTYQLPFLTYLRRQKCAPSCLVDTLARYTCARE